MAARPHYREAMASPTPRPAGGDVTDAAALTDLAIPSRRGARRRDRRGHGVRGPLLPPGMPAARSRSERFEDAVLEVAEALERHWEKELRDVEYAVEDVPPSDPSPWEHGVPLGRYFAADPVAGLSHRVVLYRRVLEARTEDHEALRALVRDVLVEQVAQLLGVRPEDVDPSYRGD